MKSDFEQRREDRAERFRELSAKNEQIADERRESAHKIMDAIPFGQPILVGHHSEKGHRADLKRIDNDFAKAREADEKAEYYARRAKAAESNRSIFSDDPNATEKLAEKIARLEERQRIMTEANRLVRKQDKEGLADLGFSEKAIEALFTPDFCGRLGFASYALQNNGANIRRLKQRVEQLEKAETDTTTETELADGVRLVDNVEENRTQLFFPGKPSEEIRAKLKSCGFRWSPREGAWQRHRSNHAVYLAKSLFAKEGEQT
jgi:hypothetical protein